MAPRRWHLPVRFRTRRDRSRLFPHACLMGLEGMVSKHRENIYRGGRFRHWIKVKIGSIRHSAACWISSVEPRRVPTAWRRLFQSVQAHRRYQPCSWSRACPERLLALGVGSAAAHSLCLHPSVARAVPSSRNCGLGFCESWGGPTSPEPAQRPNSELIWIGSEIPTHHGRAEAIGISETVARLAFTSELTLRTTCLFSPLAATCWLVTSSEAPRPARLNSCESRGLLPSDRALDGVPCRVQDQFRAAVARLAFTIELTLPDDCVSLLAGGASRTPLRRQAPALKPPPKGWGLSLRSRLTGARTALRFRTDVWIKFEILTHQRARLGVGVRKNSPHQAGWGPSISSRAAEPERSRSSCVNSMVARPRSSRVARGTSA